MANALLDGTVNDQNGAVVAGALVYVFDGRGETGGLSALFDALDQPIDNPVTADSDGYWSAYSASDQFYTLAYYWGGRKRYVESNVLLGDATINTDSNLRGDLASSDPAKGSTLVNLTRPSGQSETTKEILDRIGFSPASYGALGNGATDDHAALANLATAVAASAWHREIQLDAKSYAVGDEGGWNWTEANGAFIRGRGKSRTVIEHSGGVADGSALTLGSTQNLYMSDLTLVGKGGWAALSAPSGNSWENIVFHRVKFTATDEGLGGGNYGNGIQWVIGSAGHTAKSIWFIDCEWSDCDRMGAEFQNQPADAVHRFGNIHIIRPQVSRMGRVSAGQGMGFSLTGYHDGVLIDRPFFDDCPYACIEMIGANRTVIRDALYVPDDAGSYLVAATNDRPMYGNKIDGFKPATRFGQTMATLPTVGSQVRLDNFHDGEVRGVALKRSDVNALSMGENYPSNGNLIEDNQFASTTGTPVNCIYSDRNRFLGNAITSAGVTGISFGEADYNLVDGNHFTLVGTATALTPVAIGSNTTVKFGRNNTLDGQKLYASGSTSITTGNTQSPAVTHNIQVGATAVIFSPRNRPYGASGDLVPFLSYLDATLLQFSVNAAVSADVTLYWEAFRDYGNL